MDGYAVHAADTAGADEESPARCASLASLRLATCSTGQVEPGTAVRIMTGAPMPDGADAVVPFEETDEPLAAEGTPRTGHRPRAQGGQVGANIRRAAEDLRGQPVIRTGAVLQPPSSASSRRWGSRRYG